MIDEEYMRRLDSLARFYNAEFLAHIGYQLTFAGLIVALLSMTGSLMLTPFVNWLTKPNEPITSWTISLVILWLVVVVLLAIWFLGLGYDSSKLPYSFRYFLGRSQYYGVLSELVWAHMGVTVPRTVYEELQKRTTKLGMRQAITKLFEAQLYVSRWKMRVTKGRGEEEGVVKENLQKYFEIEKHEIEEDKDRIISLASYYPGKLLLWSRADLVVLGYEPQLRDYDYKVSKNQDSDTIAKLIRDC